MGNLGKQLVVWMMLAAGMILGLVGCGRIQGGRSVPEPEPIVVERGTTADAERTRGEVSGAEVPETDAGQPEGDAAGTGEGQPAAEASEPDGGTSEPDLSGTRNPVKAKGVYISSYVAGTPDMVDRLLEELDRTEANALVIDLKDDFGRVACQMDAPLIEEIGSVKTYIPDIEGLMEKLDGHGIYTIARIPAFRDAWLGDVRPEWCMRKADGSVFRDRDGNAWVNPYCEEAWDYLVEIALQAGKLGFDEVQFDYIRFCTEKGMQEVVFDEAEVQGRSRTEIIRAFMEYAYERLSRAGLFVSADVFGAIINSDVNADAVGQVYGEMAKHLDYISPMIYPSHYADGNYGIEHPDLQPYDTVRAALEDSRQELSVAAQDGSPVAQVRPWLQDFTATWLKHHMEYGPEQVRQQIQAVYDSGYDEWLLWDASCRYSWDGLKTPEEAEAERVQIEASRAALPETAYAAEPENELEQEGND